MTPEVKWACIRRLEAALQNQGTLDYPQAAHDALIALRELHHFKSDSQFLREEKARVWRTVTSADDRSIILQMIDRLVKAPLWRLCATIVVVFVLTAIAWE